MENIFNWDYEVEKLYNKNGKSSRFSVVYGENGNVVHTKKDSYNMVLTTDVSKIANGLIEMGYDCVPFIHKSGEIIGFKTSLGEKITKVGQMVYEAVLYIPNNGKGVGITYLKELRSICGNGMMRTFKNYDENQVKIPHNADYQSYLDVAEKTMVTFLKMCEDAQNEDESLTKYNMENEEARYRLTDYFHKYETNNKLSLDELRAALYTGEGVSGVTLRKYELLMDCFNKELEYNKELNLNLTMYTLLATVTNYLSRKREARESKLSEIIRLKRESRKVGSFINDLHKSSVTV